jgi:hypothetical protein
MAVANTPAYYDMATITSVNSFIVQAPVVDDIKRIFVIVGASKKLACLSLLSIL